MVTFQQNRDFWKHSASAIRSSWFSWQANGTSADYGYDYRKNTVTKDILLSAAHIKKTKLKSYYRSKNTSLLPKKKIFFNFYDDNSHIIDG